MDEINHLQYLTPWCLTARSILIKLHYFYLFYTTVLYFSHRISVSAPQQGVNSIFPRVPKLMKKFPVSTKNKNKLLSVEVKMLLFEGIITLLILHDLLHTLKSLKHWNYITVNHN